MHFLVVSLDVLNGRSVVGLAGLNKSGLVWKKEKFINFKPCSYEVMITFLYKRTFRKALLVF